MGQTFYDRQFAESILATFVGRESATSIEARNYAVCGADAVTACGIVRRSPHRSRQGRPPLTL